MTKKFQVLAASVVAAGLAMASPAVAEEERAFAWSFTAGATSDYIFRGISFTGEDPAAQGSIDISWGQLYVGAWASNINGAGFEPWELDIYAGYKPVVDQFTFDFGIVGYTYPDSEGLSQEYYELKAGVSTEIVKGLTGGVTFWYTPDQANYSETYSVEGTLAYTFAPVGIFTPTVSGLVGYTEDTDDTGIFALGDVNSYTYWNAGLALAVEKFVFDFRYWDTDVSSNDAAANDNTDSRFVFSAKVTLP